MPTRQRGLRPGMGRPERDTLRRALQDASYEVLPFRGTADQVLAHVPVEVPLTVTTTEAKGLQPTLDLAEQLARAGYRAAPHIAARLVVDTAHLRDVVAQLDDAGVDGVFVVGGDAAEPAGEFPDALAVLRALEEIGHRFHELGIGGYPEGHGHIGADVIERALVQKAPYATHVITQLCFHADTTVEWAQRVRAGGVELPIRVGIPGAVNRQKLMRISAGLGLGQSARFLTKQQSMLWRFFVPGGYSPDRLVAGLAPAFGTTGHRLDGLHVFTFNELAGTEAWRQALLAQLS